MITLLIVLAQQVMTAFGITYGHWDQVVGIVNTILTLCSVAGFIEGSGTVVLHGVVQAPKVQPTPPTIQEKPEQPVQEEPGNPIPGVESTVASVDASEIPSGKLPTQPMSPVKDRLSSKGIPLSDAQQVKKGAESNEQSN
ncbi:hypothetical protein [Limosilactobacillus vaginalis]|uniref:hypothetical protein n=1 Tax=Limosilactobacillus vaginalis TaxID=1633 RepID=UPI001F08FF31|nr:hypothetical protein [Limosilactobacillus vaginalis]